MYGTRPLASDGTRGGPQLRAILEPLDALRARSRSRGAQPATRHGQHQFDVCRVLLCQLGHARELSLALLVAQIALLATHAVVLPLAAVIGSLHKSFRVF